MVSSIFINDKKILAGYDKREFPESEKGHIQKYIINVTLGMKYRKHSLYNPEQDKYTHYQNF